MSSTILLVEDEERVRHAVQRMIAALGYTVVEACDGADALRVLDSAAPPVDMVLSDVAMPRMSGIELARELLGREPAVPIVLMSGYAQGAIERHGGDMPAVPFLEKPFTFEGLRRAIARALPAPELTERQKAAHRH